MIISGITVEVLQPEVAVGIVVARGCVTKEAPEALASAIDEAIAAKARQDCDAVKSAVRDLLRAPKYKPTGRGKPASEYLLKAATQDRFPRINNLVDINNLVSLASLLPISLVDLVRAQTESFAIRRGREGESYVFNPGGQVIDLWDLLLVSRMPQDAPCANPVKDSMETKLNESSTDVMAVLFAPPSSKETLDQATNQFAEALTAWGEAKTVEKVTVVSS